MSAGSIIDALSAIHPKGYDLSLGRIQRVLALLGNPQERIPPAIHVAGTNGKGSTSAFCRAILEAAGKTVHVHTSPHLVNWHERYRLGAPGGGKLVSDELLEATIARVAQANDGAPITVFEILSAAMFVLFSEHHADYSIVEVGLGGRFDATNVIETPLISVITSIALDHMAHLGDREELIAFEKAGIMKTRRPVVVAPQLDRVVEVLEKTARERRSPAWFAGQDFTFHQHGGRFVYQDDHGLMDLPLPRLRGVHQLANAATAIAALRFAGLDLPDSAFETGMESVRWPGRMERLKPGPLQARAPENCELWIDGGHNPAAGEVIASELANLEERAPMPVFIIAGMLTTKDPRGFFHAFVGLAERVFTVPIHDSEQGFGERELAQIAGECGLDAHPCLSVEDALAAISGLLNAGEPCRILICGSLYLVGEVLRENNEAPQ
jgi:dihydrofolate synthase/folylpolyglutamate synthase